MFVVFLAAAVMLAVTPGPGIFYVLTRTVAGGRREGIVSAVGTFAGGLVHVVAAGLGLSAVLATSATAFAVVKYAGAAYLFVLGVGMIRSRNVPMDEAGADGTPAPATIPHLPKEGRYGAPAPATIPHLPKEGRYGAPATATIPHLPKEGRYGAPAPATIPHLPKEGRYGAPATATIPHLPKEGRYGAPASGANGAGRRAFRQGVVTEVLNPKTALFFLSFLPQFVNPHLGHVVVQFLLLGAISVTLNTAADVVVVCFAAPLAKRLRQSVRFRRNQRVASGVAMMGLGAFVAFGEK